jgi:hypothetical protein
MNPTYYLNNVPFCSYDVVVTQGTTPLDAPLERKDSIIADWTGQHGIRRDYSEVFFKPRKFTLEILARDAQKYALFYRGILGYRPARIMQEIGCTMRNFDVFLESPQRASTWKGIPHRDTLVFSEDNPVKRVYRTAGTSAGIKLISDHALTISWGDGHFDSDVFTGNFNHTYVDDLPVHYIIVSGRVSEAEFLPMTPMDMVEEVIF